jgi:peptidyl-prolyl cis-trans isomerase SurA
MREEAYVDVAPGYTDSGASPKQIKPAYSAYTPPAPKKKKKVERTRFRETTHTFRKKSQAAPAPTLVDEDKSKSAKPANTATMRPGKKEKIRFGKAPTKTLPNNPETKTEDAGAVETAANTPPEPVNPLEVSSKPTQKTRFSARAKEVKQAKLKARGPQVDSLAPAPPDAAEVADRQAQSAPLGLAGDTASKKKKKQTTTGDKTRLTDKNKKPAPPAQTPGEVPAAQAPAPAPAPQPPAPAPSPQP